MTTIPMLEKELEQVNKDLYYYKNYSERLINKLQQKENIIKEVRKKIRYWQQDYMETYISTDELDEILEILDKVDKGE